LIDKVLVAEGDIIKKGDGIIRLINTTAELNAENAKLSADYASVAANAEKLDELSISIDVAKTKMENDNLLLQKQENLWAKQVGTHNDLLQKQLASKTSTNSYQTAKLRYKQLQKQINFQSKQAQKNLELSQKISRDFTIKSDVNGKVYQLPMKKGEMVNTLNPVAIIGDDLAFFLELQVDEYDINRIKLGKKIALSMDSYKGQVFECLVTKINPIMNEKTKSFTIEANFIKLPVAKEFGKLFEIDAEVIQTANASFETGSFVRTLISYAVGVVLLIVAGFGIYNILNMMIYEKMNTIAILKATGFAGRDVQKIFLVIAMSIGFFGGLAGLIFGFGLSALIDQIPFKTPSLPSVKTYPINYNPIFYVIGAVFSLITTFLAGWFPSRKASKVDPVVIIRGK
jgi:ABC-type antimicrobial peptide transport system permease subunit